MARYFGRVNLRSLRRNYTFHIRYPLCIFPCLIVKSFRYNTMLSSRYLSTFPKVLDFKTHLETEENLISKSAFEEFFSHVRRVDMHSLPEILLVMRDHRAKFVSALDKKFLLNIFEQFESHFLNLLELRNPHSVALCAGVISGFKYRNSAFDDAFWPTWYRVTESNLSQLSLESIRDTLLAAAYDRSSHRPSIDFISNLLAVAKDVFWKHSLRSEADTEHFKSFILAIARLARHLPKFFDKADGEAMRQLIDIIVVQGLAICTGNLHMFSLDQLMFIRGYFSLGFEISPALAVEWVSVATQKLPDSNKVHEHFATVNIVAQLASKVSNQDFIEKKRQYLDVFKSEYVRLRNQPVLTSASSLYLSISKLMTPIDQWMNDQCHKVDRRTLTTMARFEPRELARYGMTRAAICKRYPYPSSEWLARWIECSLAKFDELNERNAWQTLYALYRFKIRDMEILRRLDECMQASLHELQVNVLIKSLYWFVNLRYFPRQEYWQAIVHKLRDCESVIDICSLALSLCSAQLYEGVLDPNIVHLFKCILLERFDAVLYDGENILGDTLIVQLQLYKLVFGETWLPRRISDALAAPADTLLTKNNDNYSDMIQHHRGWILSTLRTFIQRRKLNVRVEENSLIAPLGVIVPFLLRPPTSRKPRDSVILLLHPFEHYYRNRTARFMLNAEGLNLRLDVDTRIKLLTKLGYTVCSVPSLTRYFKPYFHSTMAPLLASKYP